MKQPMVKNRVLTIVLILTVIMGAALISSCRKGGSPVELRLSLVLGANSDWYRGAEKFKELVEERTGGAYRILIYPHAQLAGNQRTELEMLQSGVIDMSIESSILLSLIEPRMSVPSLPWLFDDYLEADRILGGPLGEELLALLPPKNIVGLAYGANGFRQLTNSRNPVETPYDIAGMKIRVPGIRMYIDIFRLFQADPSSMSFAEVFTALAQGTMDGQENPLSVINSARLYEVQKYLTIWNYSYDPIILCMNRTRWEVLPDDVRALFRECAIEAMAYERGLVAGGEDAAYAALEEKGMKIIRLSDEATASFRAEAEPVYDDLTREVGGDIVVRFREAAFAR